MDEQGTKTNNMLLCDESITCQIIELMVLQNTDDIARFIHIKQNGFNSVSYSRDNSIKDNKSMQEFLISETGKNRELYKKIKIAKMENQNEFYDKFITFSSTELSVLKNHEEILKFIDIKTKIEKNQKLCNRIENANMEVDYLAEEQKIQNNLVPILAK